MRDSARVTCPKCWETIELLLDPSGGDADYSEDCPVCCQPMTVSLRVDEAGGVAVTVEAE